MQLPPKDKTLILPEEKLQDYEYWLVDVSYGPNNLIHRAICNVGFLIKDNEPSPIGELYSRGYWNTQQVSKTHYLKFLSKIEGL